MKIGQKIFVVFFLGMITLSCEQDNGINSNQIKDMTINALKSNKFKNLAISLALLDSENSQFINSEKKSILIPYLENDGSKGIVALFNNENRVIAVSYFEVISNVSRDFIYDRLAAGSFNGSFIFKTEDGKAEVVLEDSKVVKKISIDSGANSKAECNSITKPGGAADCAGARLQDMNWFDKTICYEYFAPCMAQLVISCAIDGCEVHPE